MYIKQKYLIRHKILEALQNKLSEFDHKKNINANQIELSIEDISHWTKIPISKIRENIEYLYEKNEIYLHWIKGNILLKIIRNGTISYFDKKHIQEGKKVFWSNIYERFKTISTIILVIIALVTFLFNIIDTRKNKNEIEKIKQEINQIKNNNSNKKSP